MVAFISLVCELYTIVVVLLGCRKDSFAIVPMRRKVSTTVFRPFVSLDCSAPSTLSCIDPF